MFTHVWSIERRSMYMKYDRRDPRCLYVYTCMVYRETYMKDDRRDPRCLYVYTCMV